MSLKWVRIAQSKKAKVEAFSLLEVLIVLVIIGILVLLALPDQTKVITKAKATEAKLQLQHLYALQRSHHFEYGSYSEDLEKVGFSQEELITNDGNAYYIVEMENITSTSFRATATAVVDFDNDGVFNMWEINEKKKLIEVVPD